MAEESGFRNKIIRAFGLEDLDDDYEYEEEYYEEEPIPEQKVAAPTKTQSTTSASSNSNSLPDVLVLDPTEFDEAPGIVNKLKQNKTIVVNLKQTDFEEGRKIFDFLSGAVFALEGSLNRIAESVFILAPKLVSVSTQIDDEPRTGNEYSEIISWDETN